MSAPHAPSAHGALHDFLHHLRAALAVASVVTLLHGVGVLGWLDGLMLRLVVGAGPAAGAPAAATPDLPAVLLIGPALHEGAFRQASPLDPAPMARLLAQVPLADGARPRALVVDLDLSPGPAEPEADAGRRALDDALQALVAAGVQVVLPLPLRSATDAAQQRKFAWMRRLCLLNEGRGAGLAFALPDVVTHQGAALQFDAAAPSLGVVAQHPAAHPGLCRRVLEGERWRAPLLSAAFTNQAAVEPARQRLRPFNTRVFVAGDAVLAIARSTDALPADLPPLAGRTLFVGAGYNPQDRFLVPVEGPDRPVEGVMVHAAIHHSLQHPVAPAEGLLAFLIDVVLGIGLGYVFAASWGWHQRVADANAGAASVARLWRPRGSLLANFVLAGLLAAAGVVLANRFFFPLNWWVNPGPIVLGLFTKFVLASRGGHGDAGPANPALRRRDEIDLLLLVVLVAATLVVLLMSEH